MECRLKAKKCGGCPMLGLDYAEQLKQKEAAVRKLVGKYGPVAPIRGAENPCHYRNKVISTFAAGPGGKLMSGIYAAGTHKVFACRKLPAAGRSAGHRDAGGAGGGQRLPLPALQ